MSKHALANIVMHKTSCHGMLYIPPATEGRTQQYQ